MVLTEEDPNIFEIAANATNLPLEVFSLKLRV